MAQTVSLFVDFEKIRLTREGEWLSNGEEITHQNTVRAFARNLHRTAEGGWEIRLGPESKAVEVEDCALFIVSLEGSPETGFRLNLSDGTQARLRPETLAYQPGRLVAAVPYVPLGGAERQELARFNRAPYNEILRGLQQDSLGYFVVIANRRIDLARN